MVPTPVYNPEADARTASRSSLYLSAALHCDGSSWPVKIRNLSSSGALVEGLTGASLDSRVDLVRGRLIVRALVVWSREGRCGLKFSDLIDVPKWRAAPANAEQQRVDEIVRVVKAGAVPLPVRRTLPLSDPVNGTHDLSGDLRRISELLDGLGDALTSDPELVTRHGTALQNLDIALQMIAAVEATMVSPGGSEVDATKLDALRRSADQALNQHSF